MAVYNEVQVGRYVRFLQKFLQIKGRQPAPLTIAGEIIPVFGLFHGAENRYLEAWDRFSVGLQQPAVAAQISRIQLRNPSGSNTLFVVEKLVFSVSIADTLILLNGISADLATTITGPRLDSRGRANSVGIASRQAAAGGAGLNNLFFWQGIANTPIEGIVFEEQEIPLLPGDGLQVATNSVNEQLTCSFFWRERFLEEAERA